MSSNSAFYSFVLATVGGAENAGVDSSGIATDELGR